ncbi:PilZ domain-containing protein [Kaarinaea lacus]
MATRSNVSPIEHRFKHRKPLQLDVVIYKNHVPIAVGKTRDISSDGMGIDSKITNIKKYSLLEVELGVNDSSSTVYHRLSGLVVHHQTDGFGILFTQLNPDDSTLLNQLMIEQ